MKDCRRNRGRQRAPIVVPTVLVDSLRPLPRELGRVAVYGGRLPEVSVLAHRCTVGPHTSI